MVVPDVGYGKHITINREKAEPITLTGMSKSPKCRKISHQISSQEITLFGQMCIIKMVLARTIKRNSQVVQMIGIVVQL